MIGAIAGCLLIVVLSAREILRAGLDPQAHDRQRPLGLVAYPLLVVVVVAIGLRLADILT